MGASTYGRSLAPRVSSRINTGLTADCTGLEIDPGKENSYANTDLPLAET